MLKIYIFFLLYVILIFFFIYIRKKFQYINKDYSVDHYYIKRNNLSQMFINAIVLYNQKLPYIFQTYNKFKSCKGKKKVVIVLLHFKYILSFIDRNYYFLNFKYYDELIFFVTEKKKSANSEYRGIEYKVIDISQTFYKFPFKFNKSKYTPNYQKGGLWNYQHMCKFFFKDIFFHPVMCDVDLFMRLDSDSLINTSLNLFKYMNKNIVYMHNRILNDGAAVTKGLKDFTYSLVSELKIRSKDEIKFNLTFKKNPLLYYNNFEICRTSFFRSKEMFQFSNIVDLSYGQFIYRWGDAPLRYISLSLFAENSSKIEIPKDVQYCHHTCNKK